MASTKVRAQSKGYYGAAIREAGDEFTLASEAEFSPRWMEWADGRPAEAPADSDGGKAKAKPAQTPKPDDGGKKPDDDDAKPLGIMPKVAFKDEARGIKVGYNDAFADAVHKFTTGENAKTVAEWNALSQDQRRELIVASGEAMLAFKAA